uniref:GPI inositol-deacylase winged helix domain-containing protein n=1 Tax=Bionectria ochroleuca TaxID=29856 RepID=A0A8H7K5D7_BIOOC
MVRKVLSIVLAANQPLTLKELNIATNIDYETKSLEDIDLEDEDDFKKRIRSWCGLFILISQGHVYFLHQTAREFLIANSSSTSPVAPFPTRKWEHSITTQSAQAVLAELCVLYLALAHPEVIPAADEHNDMVKFMDQQPFFVYSALNWGLTSAMLTLPRTPLSYPLF